MRLNFSMNQSYALLVSAFLIIIPLATFVRYYENPEILKIAVILFINFFAISLFLLFSKADINYQVKNLEFSALGLHILSILCLFPLVLFVSNSIQGDSLIEIAIFSEKYRQGTYSGSGIYTAWSTQILPLLIFVILINNGPSKSLIIPVLVVILACLILGLRIHLWGLFFGFFFKMLSDLNIKKMLYGAFFILLFFSYKYLLNPQSEIAAYDLFVDQLTRPDLHAIVKYNIFADNIIDLFEYFPVLRHLSGHDLSAFKEFYVPSIPNLGVLMPFVSQYSGVALPGYVILYNLLFVLAVIPIFLILYATYNLIVMIRKTRQIFLKFVFAYLFVVMSLTLLEDVNIIYKLEEEMSFAFLSYTAYILISARKKIKFTRIDE